MLRGSYVRESWVKNRKKCIYKYCPEAQVVNKSLDILLHLHFMPATCAIFNKVYIWDKFFCPI